VERHPWRMEGRAGGGAPERGGADRDELAPHEGPAERHAHGRAREAVGGRVRPLAEVAPALEGSQIELVGRVHRARLRRLGGAVHVAEAQKTEAADVTVLIVAKTEGQRGSVRTGAPDRSAVEVAAIVDRVV